MSRDRRAKCRQFKWVIQEELEGEVVAKAESLLQLKSDGYGIRIVCGEDEFEIPHRVIEKLLGVELHSDEEQQTLKRAARSLREAVVGLNNAKKMLEMQKHHIEKQRSKIEEYEELLHMLGVTPRTHSDVALN